MSAEKTNKTAHNATSCAAVQQHMLEDSRLDVLPEPLRAHLENCADCCLLQTQLQKIDDAVHEQAPELPEGFELALRRRLNEVADEKENRTSSKNASRRWMRPALAAAAALIAAVGAAVLIGYQHDAPSSPITYRQLHLAIRVDSDHKDVFFDVDLPPGVRALPTTGALVGDGQQLRWRSHLQRGLNEIDLPLMAHNMIGTVQVRVRSGGYTISGRVDLRARAAAMPSLRHDLPHIQLALACETDRLRLRQRGRQ